MLTSTLPSGRTIAFRKGNDDIGIITFYTQHDDSYLVLLSEALPDTTIYALRIDDWNNELSPWKAPAVFGKDDFGDGAEDTLSVIVNEIVPMMDCERYIIGGYSLAGLFSLWGCYRSGTFSGCAASSPSVWFPDWDVFIRENTFKAKTVCLSLGTKEHRTKNRIMSTVKERIQQQYDSLLPDLGSARCSLLWNDGGHFKDIPQRIRSSFLHTYTDLAQISAQESSTSH